jgi:integrase
MAKKGNLTTAAPMNWDQFQNLISRMAFDLDKLPVNRKKSHARLMLLIAVGCYCGLRAGDILSLTWEQVTFTDILIIAEQKTSKTRSITINAELKNIINRVKAIIQPLSGGELIFLNADGTGTLSIQYINRTLKKIFIKYGIKSKSVSSHTLRKTFGLRVFEKNYKSEEALITLSEIFNHSSTAITRRYIGLQAEKIQNIYLTL